MRANEGFTIIELMIVVAIIGGIVALAVPAYQNYIVRAQITAAVGELNGAKSQYELIMNDSSASNIADFTVTNMFFSTSSNFCEYDVKAPLSGEANPALICKLKNVTADIVGETVYLNRAKDGTWSCSTTSGVNQKYKPNFCN